MIVFGLVNHFLLSVFLGVKNRFDCIGTQLVRITLLAILAQTVLMWVTRFNHGGRVCSGAYDHEGFDVYQTEKYYVKDEGKFLEIWSVLTAIFIVLLIVTIFASKACGIKKFDCVLRALDIIHHKKVPSKESTDTSEKDD